MIRVALPEDLSAFSSTVRLGLELLLDLSGIVRTIDDDADVVVLHLDRELLDGVRTARELAEWRPRVRDGEVIIGTDTLDVVASIASAQTEQSSTASDRYRRVPSRVNMLVAEGVERMPVLDIAAGRLRQCAIHGAGKRVFRLLPPWPSGSEWSAALTHDLDVVGWWPLFAGLRWLELARGRHFEFLGLALSAAIRESASDPVAAAAREVLAIEARYAVRSTWFVMAGKPSFNSFRRGDLTYRLEHPRARAVARAVIDAKGEIGLHGSFATMQNAEAFRAERERAASITGSSVDGVRQHFLRMRPPITQRAMASAGFRYDATFGFPDRNGFRLGTASPITAWDAHADLALPICLAPLTWMDRAMSKYSGVQDPSRWVDDALDLATTVRAVGGMWVGLWHPNLTSALGYPNAPAQYERLVHELRERGAYIAPLGELLSYRRQRRAFRVTRIAANGAIQSNDSALEQTLREPAPIDDRAAYCTRLT
jgi:peptidoglycan/xylan/chitin deacetylase (PgdA/CDA1 family)